MGRALCSLSGNASAPLLPETVLALELPSDLRAVALEIPAPELTLNALAAVSNGVPELPHAVPKRRAEFAAGRHAAALALAGYGCFEAVPRTASGAPSWPLGYCGSISHGAGLAVALVAPSANYVGLGIDVEQLIPEALSAEIGDRILEPEEFARLRDALPGSAPSVHLSLGFSAKESLFKCLNPLLAEFFEFDGAQVRRVQPESATRGLIWLALTRPLNAEFRAGFEFPGCYAFAAGRVESAIWLARSRTP